jgi:Leucine-rich repeat (LRR) protein
MRFILSISFITFNLIQFINSQDYSLNSNAISCDQKCECSLNELNELNINCVTTRYGANIEFPSNFELNSRLADVKEIHAMLGETNHLQLDTCHFKNLEKIILDANKLTEIPKLTRECHNELSLIVLSRNQIRKVKEYSFSQMDNLNKIVFSGNKIESIETNAFSQLPVLKKLDLSHNRIKSINGKAFENVNLVTLDVSNNKIEEIKNNDFENLDSLEIIDLSKNQIKAIEDEVFKNLLNLRKLFLSDNQIELMIETKDLKNLKTLVLARNKISVINFENLKGLKKLNSLDLSGNKIKNIIPIFQYDITQLPHIQHINLSHNSLTEIEMWPLYIPTMKTIDLRSNLIKRFSNKNKWKLSDASDVPALDNGTIIDLSYNQIKLFNDKTIQQYGICSSEDYYKFYKKYFFAFSLNENPIICNCNAQQRLIHDTTALLYPLLTPPWDITCAGPNEYKGFQILGFECKVTVKGYQYCDNTTISTAKNINIFQPKEMDTTPPIKSSTTTVSTAASSTASTASITTTAIITTTATITTTTIIRTETVKKLNEPINLGRNNRNLNS